MTQTNQARVQKQTYVNTVMKHILPSINIESSETLQILSLLSIRYWTYLICCWSMSVLLHTRFNSKQNCILHSKLSVIGVTRTLENKSYVW